MNDILDAAYYGEAGQVRTLLDNGIDVNTTDPDLNTPLHMAALGGHTDCVQLLIERKANVEAVNVAGNTPLHLAVTTAPLDCIELQLKAGAPVNACNENGDSPLDYAIGQLVTYSNTTEHTNSPLVLIKLLLQSGADAEHAHTTLVGFYRSHGAENRVANCKLKYTSDRRSLLEMFLLFGLEPGWTDEQGDTLLHVLCRCNAPSADLELLVNHNFDINARNHAGETPLLVYLDKSEPPPLAGLIVLLNAGADKINAASRAGRTPIRVAKAFSGHAQYNDKRVQILIDTLMDYGADESAGTAWQ